MVQDPPNLFSGVVAKPLWPPVHGHGVAVCGQRYNLFPTQPNVFGHICGEVGRWGDGEVGSLGVWEFGSLGDGEFRSLGVWEFGQ